MNSPTHTNVSSSRFESSTATLGMDSVGNPHHTPQLIQDGKARDSEDGESSQASIDDDRLEAGVLKDRFGFFVTEKHHKYLEVPPEIQRQRKAKEASRTKKWLKMIRQWKKYNSPSRIEKLKSRVRKGIPDAVRGFVWYQFAHGETVKSKYPDVRQIDVTTLPTVVVEEVGLHNQSFPLFYSRNRLD